MTQLINLVYRNILEAATVVSSSADAAFPLYRLYDRDIGKLFKFISKGYESHLGDASFEVDDETGSTYQYGDFSNGNAFFWSSLDLSSWAGNDINYTPHGIVLWDGSNKNASGYIGAFGTGKALGAELLTGWTNVNYNVFASAGADITDAQDTTPAAEYADTNTFSVVAGKLYEIDYNLTVDSGQIPFIYVRKADGSGWDVEAFSLTPGAHTKYFQASVTGSGAYIRYSNSVASHSACAFSCKNVSEAPATGLHIVSALNGSTRNWAGIDSGFNFNNITAFSIYINPFVIKATQSASNIYPVDRLIIPAGHNFNGYALKLQYSTDNFVSDINTAVSWTQGDTLQIDKSFTAATKQYWRLCILRQDLIPELSELYLGKIYEFQRNPGLGLIEGDQKNISRHETQSGKVRRVKLGDPRRHRQYSLTKIGAAQKSDFETWDRHCEGVKSLYLTDHNGTLFFAELLNDIKFRMEHEGRFGCDLELLEVLA